MTGVVNSTRRMIPVIEASEQRCHGSCGVNRTWRFIGSLIWVRHTICSSSLEKETQVTAFCVSFSSMKTAIPALSFPKPAAFCSGRHMCLPRFPSVPSPGLLSTHDCKSPADSACHPSSKSPPYIPATGPTQPQGLPLPSRQVHSWPRPAPTPSLLCVHASPDPPLSLVYPCPSPGSTLHPLSPPPFLLLGPSQTPTPQNLMC